MTKLEFKFYEDGREMVISRMCEEADLYELLYFFADAARCAGFTYVEQVGSRDDDGNEKWCDW